MKHLTILLMLFPIWLGAQNISVKSFTKVQNDMTARVTYPLTDQNGEKCAIIKMVTTEKGFKFEGDMMGLKKTEYKTGEYWIYLPNSSNRITIKHDKLGILRNYVYPIPIEEATVYIMELITGKVTTIVEDYVAPTNWLIVTSEPTGADFYINEVNKGITPFQQEMDEGSYSYMITTDLYHSEAGKFTINAEGDRTEIKATLKPNFGYAKITTVPESGATVYVNSKQLTTTTPVTTKRLKSRKYTIQVEKNLYYKETKEITITDNETTDVNITMRPTFGDFKITSVPETGATVILDGENTGKTTPCSFDRLNNGEHTISLRKEWYQPKAQRITVKEGETRQAIVTMLPTFGTLNITAEHNAKIYIDNTYKATTSWQGRLIGGYHTIEAKLDKYKTNSKKINIEIGQTSNLSLHPQPIYGIAKIITTPFDATIKINDKEYGTTPTTLKNLFIGDYTLTLAKQGYGTITKTITIAENKTITINETLPSGKPVTINSTPSGATLYIEGTAKGTTPFTEILSFADHAIKLINGKKTVEQIITVSQNGKSSWSFDVSENEGVLINGILTDKRDNQKYKVIKIGNQTWMAENLRYAQGKYITSESQWDNLKDNNLDAAYCWYDNNTSNKQKYGALYTYAAAKKACPAGWHLPIDEEWKTLEIYLGMKKNDADDIGWRASGGVGKKLKSKSGWDSNGNGTDEYGFTAFPGGYRSNDGGFDIIGNYGYWWSATGLDNHYAYYRGLNYNYSVVIRNRNLRSWGFSVRCLRDN